MIQSLSCIGFRSFSSKKVLNLAVPNGEPGSGLTVLVGPNGGGKSTLVECFNKVSLANRGVSFSKGKRNLTAGDRVEIEVNYDASRGILKTIGGGSETKWEGTTAPPKIYYLPSRRFFNPFFGKNRWDRDTFLQNTTDYQQRSIGINSIAYRLIDLNASDPSHFNDVLSRVLGHKLSWTIDQEDNGNYIVKITNSYGLHHNSDGLGEGIVSLMFIVDALCGNSEELLVLDEPELSLHPQLQVRLMRELLEKTRTSQVIISTHSPNMLSLDSIVHGGMVARVFDSGSGSEICMINDESRDFIQSVSHNLNNPHILGTDARACFFAEDGLIITEGQEDVMLYPVIMDNLGLDYSISFFGFGAGGASEIVKIAHLLQVLGFKRVGAIYDMDKKDEYNRFCAIFGSVGYKAWIIPADDVRDKEKYEVGSKAGLLEKDRKTLKTEYKEPLNALFKEMNDYLIA